MPRVAPFRGLHYAVTRFGATTIPERVALPDDATVAPAAVADLTDVACPPYDVIDAPLRESLLRRHGRNAVRLELAAEDDPHGAAADAMSAWLADGTLVRRDEPTAYYYRHGTPSMPGEASVEGVVVRVLLEAWGSGVRPHEHTMPGPKADRLALLRATRTQLSPILAVYFDRSQRYDHVMGRAWSEEWRARDDDGLVHQLVAIEADDRLLGYLGRQTLFVADGHHRYETALAYQREVRDDPRFTAAARGELAADWIMVQLVNAERVELEILATHRLILDGDPDALRSLPEDPAFTAVEMAPELLADALADRRDEQTPAFGLVLPGGVGWLLVGDPGTLAVRLRREPMSMAVQRLDLAALHVALLGDRIGITAEDVAAGSRLAYTRDAADAIARVASGAAAAAVLVRPTRIDQLADVANAGDVMPQKSTYFYPKLLTGMVFNPLED